MKRTLFTFAALYLLHRRQKAMEMRLQAMEEEWRALELALDAAVEQIEPWPREEGAQ